MKSVPSAWAARSRRAATVTGGRVKGTLPPAPLDTAGRGLSVGSSSNGGAPAKVSFQNAKWGVRDPSATRPCCQAAKSAYWTRTGSTCGAAPPAHADRAAPRSDHITAQDHPSDTPWWVVRTRAAGVRAAEEASSVTRSRARKSTPPPTTAKGASTSARAASDRETPRPRARVRRWPPGRMAPAPSAGEATTATAVPSLSRSTKPVRSDSWRATSQASAASRAGTPAALNTPSSGRNSPML